MFDCKGLYHCNSWSCKSCFSKKVYWLRERALSFAVQLNNQETYFTTLKGYSTPDSAFRDAMVYIDALRREKPRYNAKLEYFFVVAKHGFSNWHIHILSNYKINASNFYCETVKDLKASCLYLVSNLVRSMHADYQKTRRYSASSLLNKNNLKKAYKTRIRLYRLKTLLRVQDYLIACHLRSRVQDNRTIKRCNQVSCSSDVIKPIPQPTPQTIRPPPFGIIG